VFLVGVSFRVVNREMDSWASFLELPQSGVPEAGLACRKSNRHARNLLRNFYCRALSNFPLVMNRKVINMSNVDSPKKTRDTL